MDFGETGELGWKEGKTKQSTFGKGRIFRGSVEKGIHIYFWIRRRDVLPEGERSQSISHKILPGLWKRKKQPRINRRGPS